MKIIIVEDERKSLMGLTALIGQLEERWDIVGTAGNGEEGVRLIAINARMDSLDEEDDFTPFRNIIHEFYVRDTSRKIR